MSLKGALANTQIIVVQRFRRSLSVACTRAVCASVRSYLPLDISCAGKLVVFESGQQPRGVLVYVPLSTAVWRLPDQPAGRHECAVCCQYTSCLSLFPQKIRGRAWQRRFLKSLTLIRLQFTLKNLVRLGFYLHNRVKD